MTDQTTEQLVEGLDDYRARARRWVEQNLERQAPGGPSRLKPWELEEQTTEQLAEQRALQRRLFEAGFAGITWPVEYGGQGLGAAYERAFHEEAAGFVLPDLGIAGGATFGVCAPTMLAHASPDFLRRHIPRVLAGELIVSQFFSDPDAGSDLAGVRTQAVRDGDRWILTGSKIWSSGAYYADAGMCLARTDWDVPKHRGLTWFLVPTDAPGLTIERIRQINGDAEFCQEYLDEVEIADADRIGEVNDGWNVTQTMLLYERGAGSAGGGGAVAAGVRADVLGLAESVGALDDPLARDALARIHVDDLARASLGRRLLARMVADPGNAGNLASYGKLASGVFDPIRANRALEIAGDAALAWDDPGATGAAASMGLLNSRFMAIAGGTSQMQRNTVGERVLGLPREPAFDRRKPFRDVVRDSRDWSGAVG
jgi:alkylation response protein AidB-like acyl-CoA dehydrogenase